MPTSFGRDTTVRIRWLWLQCTTGTPKCESTDCRCWLAHDIRQWVQHCSLDHDRWGTVTEMWFGPCPRRLVPETSVRVHAKDPSRQPFLPLRGPVSFALPVPPMDVIQGPPRNRVQAPVADTLALSQLPGDAWMTTVMSRPPEPIAADYYRQSRPCNPNSSNNKMICREAQGRSEHALHSKCSPVPRVEREQSFTGARSKVECDPGAPRFIQRSRSDIR